MKMLMPKQHGAWAMLIIPFVLGAGMGEFTWLHLPLFGGWLFLYLSTYPMMMWAKNKKRDFHAKWFFAYFLLALLLLAMPLWKEWKLIYFGLLMLPFLMINLYYAKRNDERALFNDLSAIAAFGVGGVASYYLGVGRWDGEALGIWVVTMMFFAGSTFFVKTMIREKQNPIYRWFSWAYHLLLIAGSIMAGFPLLAIVFIPSVVRAIGLYGRNLTMMKLGVLEIVNSVYFLITMFLFF